MPMTRTWRCPELRALFQHLVENCDAPANPERALIFVANGPGPATGVTNQAEYSGAPQPQEHHESRRL